MAAKRRNWTDSYKICEKLTEEFDDEEKAEDAVLRDENQLSYMRRQREKQLSWEAEMRIQGKDPEAIKAEMQRNRCGCASNSLNMAAEFLENAAKKKDVDAKIKSKSGHGHGHGHGHGDKHECGHSHKHGEKCTKKKQQNFVPPKLTCGYADPATLRKIAEEKKKTPQLSLPEKNRRKMIAVEATQIDGNKFFREGKYEQALAVYERGCLIINGAYGMPDEDWEKMQDAEAKLDLNIALIKIKMEEWSSAIDHCKMSLNIKKKNPKAYYRWAEALIGMAEYDEALKQNGEALRIHPKSQGALAQKQRILDLAKIQEMRAKEQDKIMSEALRNKWGAKKKKKKENVNKTKKEDQKCSE